MTQIGEPVSVPGSGGSAQRKEWTARVVEISFAIDVTASRGQSAISAPHWKDGEDPSDTWSLTSTLGLPDAPYSKKAAVYRVKKAGGPTAVEVKVRVTRCVNVSGTGRLKGAIGSLEVAGDCPLAAGDHTVSAQITEMPEAIAYFRGMMNWRMESDDLGQTAMNSTLIELFFILDNPIPAFSAGVWVEALRLVCLRGPVTGIERSDEARAVANITRYCHSFHGMLYDTVRGGSVYLAGGDPGHGGTFLLGDWLAKARTRLNCYDQAGAVQTLSGCLGVTLSWIYLAPFGFILPTNLVGVGQCNNPFYMKPPPSQALLPDASDTRRTAFGNHAFIEHGSEGNVAAGVAVGALVGAAGGAAIGAAVGAATGDVGEDAAIGAVVGAVAGGVAGGLIEALAPGGTLFDACAGPHLGTENRAQYVTASIDPMAAYYTRYVDFRPGTPADMETCSGVTAVS